VGLIGTSSRLRVLIIDMACAVALAAGLVAAQVLGLVRIESGDAAATALLVIGPLGLRRTAPVLATLGVALGVIATGGQLTAVDLAAFALAAFSMADSEISRRWSLLVLALITTMVGLWFVAHGSPDAVGLSTVAALPAWLAGDFWRERRLRARSRMAAAQAEQEARVQAAVSAERRRLARELHDVVAHEVGVMLVQTGGARQVLATSPERATDALLAVEAAGRAALTELRRMLDLLTEDPEVRADRPPEPGLGDIEAMTQRLRDAGLPVQLSVTGEPHSLSAELGLAAYRIIQEALTNSIKHAHGAPTEVRLATNLTRSWSRSSTTGVVRPEPSVQDVASRGCSSEPRLWEEPWRPGRGWIAGSRSGPAYPIPSCRQRRSAVRPRRFSRSIARDVDRSER
jgi:signal transduction histidine kinase